MSQSVSPLGSVLDWIRRRREESQGLTPSATAPTVTGSADVPEDVSRNQPSPTYTPPAAGQAPGYDPYDPTLPYPANTTDTLEKYYNDLKDLENEIHRLRQIVGDSSQPVLRRDQAQEQLVIQEATRRDRLNQIGAEENRRADNARADAAAKSAEERRQEAERKAEAEKQAAREREQATTPGEGQTRRVPVSWTGEYGPAQGTVEERYSKGVWSRVPNSFKPEEGFGGTGQTAQGRLELQTAELNLKIAQQKFEEATSPQAKEQAQLALDLARFNLERARAEAQRADRPQVIPSDTASPVITTRNPVTGEITTQPNPAYQGPTFADATAAYNAQVPRLQQAARTERDRLLELQRQGAISEADAERQFTQWFAGNVETPLAGYRAAAEEAQRKEQRENEALQRAENARVEALNRQREQLGLEAGQKAMLQLAEIAPQIRTPQFLSQFGATVERMGQRAGAQSAEAAAALPSGSTFTKDTFSAEQARPHVPDFNQFAQQATQRALAQISPAVAAKIGANAPPPLPTGPTLQGMLQGLPYRGPLAGLPSPTSGLQPTPGMNPALDIGGGMARTPYGPGGNVYLDWRIPQ